MIIDIIIAVSAIATAFLIFLTLRTAKRTLMHERFADLQKEYRSVEMGEAIEQLYKYKSDDKKEVVKAYNESINKKNRKNHYKRRIVTQFYHSLADLYFTRVIEPELVFRTWAIEDLQIIPDIIFPIEKEIRTREGRPELKEEEYILTQFYDEAKKYSEKNP